MIDTTSEFGARAERRLREETTGWLTTVSPQGTPWPAPVWFLYDGAPGAERLIVYSYNKARRNEHIPLNPRVAFTLNTNPGGGDVVVLTGTARIAPDLPGALENEPYLDKYMAMVKDEPSLGTPEKFAQDYGVKIEVTGLKLRGF